MPLITLPPELYYFIFRYLDEKDLLSIALVCKSLSNIIDKDERVWQGVCHRKYNCTYKYKSINWKYHVRSVGDLSFPYHHDNIDEWIVKLTQSNYVNFRSVFVLEHLGDQFSTETKEIVFQNLLQCGKDEEASVLVNELENLTVSNKNLLNVAIDTHCWTTCHFLLEKLKSFDQNVIKDYLNEEAQPCLHRAVGTTNYQLVKQLIDVNADVNFQDQFGNTPLHACSTKFFNCKNMGTNEDLKIVQLLLDNQANPNTVNMRGWNTAFNVYYLPALRLLVQNQVDINARYFFFSFVRASRIKNLQLGQLLNRPHFIGHVEIPKVRL